MIELHENKLHNSFADFVCSHGLTQVVEKPTRGNNILDIVVLCSDVLCCNDVKYCHQFILVIIIPYPSNLIFHLRVNSSLPMNCHVGEILLKQTGTVFAIFV